MVSYSNKLKFIKMRAALPPSILTEVMKGERTNEGSLLIWRLILNFIRHYIVCSYQRNLLRFFFCISMTHELWGCLHKMNIAIHFVGNICLLNYFLQCVNQNSAGAVCHNILGHQYLFSNYHLLQTYQPWIIAIKNCITVS